MRAAPDGRARAAFLAACRLDVQVRKPGNVSLASPGHGMQAAQFLASAEAAAEALFDARLERVGDRIEAAVAASLARAGCNTNLGIVLLAAPLAVAWERREGDLRSALETVLAGLDRADAQAAFRAIAQAHPGGLGRAAAEDVHDAPSVGLREAMRLAADRDRIALQYATGYAELYDVGLAALRPTDRHTPLDALPAQAVQRVFLAFLAHGPDSHIVRKFDTAVAQAVTRDAAQWRARADGGLVLDTEPAFAAWDDALKARGLNPGTSADLTVATLMLHGLGADTRGQG